MEAGQRAFTAQQYDAASEQLQSSLGAAYRLERELGGGGMSRVWVATEIYYPEETSTGYILTRLAEGLAAERVAAAACLLALLNQELGSTLVFIRRTGR